MQDRPAQYRQLLEKSEGRLTPDVLARMPLTQQIALDWRDPNTVAMGWGEFLQGVHRRGSTDGTSAGSR